MSNKEKKVPGVTESAGTEEAKASGPELCLHGEPLPETVRARAPFHRALPVTDSLAHLVPVKCAPPARHEGNQQPAIPASLKDTGTLDQFYAAGNIHSPSAFAPTVPQLDNRFLRFFWGSALRQMVTRGLIGLSVVCAIVGAAVLIAWLAQHQ